MKRRRILVCINPEGVVSTYGSKLIMSRLVPGFNNTVVPNLKLPTMYKGHWIQWSIIQFGDREDRELIRKYQKELLRL